ncbi:hypothetical protein F5I97DRAFT_1827911 [Phlebopus sp. FC_14]|nr:hypothetical protein F5I97DRAFT_1827911 [Phlebopus sp. FC_14]
MAAQQTGVGPSPELHACMRGIFEARTDLRHNPLRPIVTALDEQYLPGERQPLWNVEWASADDRRRESILPAREQRLRMAPTIAAHTQHSTDILSSSGSSGSSAAPTTARGNRILRVDWLGSKVAFGVHVRHEEFARRIRLPDSDATPETWVVEFRKLPST